MDHQDGFFTGVSGAKIYYQCWLPPEKPAAVLLIVHGLAEHSGRYMNVVNHFLPRGYAVYGFNHIGHGQSEGRRGYVNRFDDFIETLKIYGDLVGEWQSGCPLFLVGHSMGGLISAGYLLDPPVFLSGPAVKAPKTYPGRP